MLQWEAIPGVQAMLDPRQSVIIPLENLSPGESKAAICWVYTGTRLVSNFEAASYRE